MAKSLFMETTGISAEQTAHEISRLLGSAGASKIVIDYNPDRTLKGLAFILPVNGQDVPFILPLRIEPVTKILISRLSPMNRGKEKYQEQCKAQGERVAWRQLLRWLQAQLAMIDTGMVSAGEVFLPYIQTAPGVTLWEKMLQEQSFKKLSAPK